MKKTLLSLVILGVFSIFGQTKPVKSIEGLKAAYNGESTASAKYAKFAEAAEKENDAKKSFTWAMDTEKTFPGEWYVCPKCGNTYNVNTVKEACDFSMTPKAKFSVFK
ncbi:MAG: hypothetical protein D4R64_11530 [Porphyromonadaceae bacterium]|nr:MAG: hypothetical protein D4R64_11530 [Porphyromonadaceae bacterium]